jgi:glyoxylase-like metal-dependent hydrolase (beta-lactamase superfamily II)
VACSVDVFPVPPFQENTYLFSDLDAGVALAVDPGGRVPEILDRARERKVEIVLIANTHAHIDHVMGVAEMQAATGAPFRLHPDAARTLARMPEQAELMGLGPVRVPQVDAPLAAGDRFHVGTQEFSVRYTPGHAPGHVTLVAEGVPMPGGPADIAFCGDVIFRGSIGRTDLEGGDYDLLMSVIDTEIMTLAPDTLLLSGHGPRTTVAVEAATNPFVLEWRGSR